MNRYLLDTNLLVYPHDAGEVERGERARAVLAAVVGRAAVPAHALAEFAAVALRKLVPPLDPAQVYEQVDRLARSFDVIPLTAPIALEALRGVRDARLPYFDAQVWAAAKLAQIPVVLSEDFATGSTLEGVTFVNPLPTSFDVATL